MRAREVAVLENKVECTQHQLENTRAILSDADETLKRLDTEFAEKSEAVEQLDSDIKDKSAELESTSEQLVANQQLLLSVAEKVTQIEDIDSISVKHSMIGGKVTLATDDYEKVSDLAKKQIVAENDNAPMVEEISDLKEQVKELQEEQAVWYDERSALRRTIDSLKAQVKELSNRLSVFKEKYNKVMEFIEKFDLKEKLDKFLHPIKNIKHKR
jgi:chromosome segregation ATPase